MERLFGPLKARFSDVLASMSPRDRKLFVGLVVGGYLVVLGGLFWFASRQLADVQSRIASAEQTLGLVTGLAADAESASADIKRIDEQMAKYAGQDLASFVERAAQKTGVSTNLQGVREKQVVTEGSVEEHMFTIDVAKVSLQQLVEFLYEIETTGYPLKIRTMKTKVVSVSGVKMLNVSMEVSAFRMLAETEPAPAEGGEG